MREGVRNRESGGLGERGSLAPSLSHSLYTDREWKREGARNKERGCRNTVGEREGERRRERGGGGEPEPRRGVGEDDHDSDIYV